MSLYQNTNVCFYRRNMTNSTNGWTTNGILLWCKLKNSTSEFLYSPVFTKVLFFLCLRNIFVPCGLTFYYCTLLVLVPTVCYYPLSLKCWEGTSESRQSCVWLSGKSILDCPQASSKWLAEDTSLQLLCCCYKSDEDVFCHCIHSQILTALWIMAWIVILTLIQRR